MMGRMGANVTVKVVLGGAATEMIDDELVAALLDIRKRALELQEGCGDELAAVPDDVRPSAVNLLHYLALRQYDVRDLQRALAGRGLSSLGRAESHVLATIDAVLDRLGAPARGAVPDAPSFNSSNELIAAHNAAALGPLPASGPVRLMVTVPSEAADDRGVIRDLVDAGMDLARINCAHDNAAAWRAMAAAVRAEGERVGRTIRVAFDLAGPKLRTGVLEPGPAVLRARPRRGVDGAVQRPAQIRFVTADAATSTDPDIVVVPVTGIVLDGVAVGDEIRASRHAGAPAPPAHPDGRPGRSRRRATAPPTSQTGTRLERRPRRRTSSLSVRVGELPATASFIRLEHDDRLRVRRDLAVGRPAHAVHDGAVLEPATIGCELASVFAAIAVGHRVLIDDGSIEGVVERVEPDSFDVVITRPDEAKLKGEKGINLPDTRFVAPALTIEDRAALDVIAPLADLVSLSFVRSVDDVVELRAALDVLRPTRRRGRAQDRAHCRVRRPP